MRHKKLFALFVVGLLLAMTAVPVWAKPPQDVHIEVDETITPLDDPEPFIASGPAVDAGIICATGHVGDVASSTSGPPGGSFVNIHADKHFECDDLSGTFDVRLNVRLDISTGVTTARWRVTGGTGAYTHLHANGSLAGTPIVPGVSITDVYDGQAH